MVSNIDIRWKQRFNNFHRACQRLIEVTERVVDVDNLSELEREGLVRRFEYTFELAWKVLQDLLRYKGYDFVSGPNGTLRMAFADGLISNHDEWWQMAKARNMLSHVYSDDEAEIVLNQIFSQYAPLLKSLDSKLMQLAQANEH